MTIHDDEVARLRKEEALRHADRRAVSRRFASTLSHALGSPLNVIAGRAAMIRMGRMSAMEIAENLRIIEEQVRSITKIIQSTLAFARADEPRFEHADVSDLLARASAHVAPIACADRMSLDVASARGLVVYCAPDRLMHVATTLLSYAVSKVGAGGRVLVRAEQAHATPPITETGYAYAGEHVRISVKLEGVRLDLARFGGFQDPWLEAPKDDLREALLLGVLFGVPRDHGGWLAVESEQDGGAEFVLNWPIEEAQG